MNLFFHYFIHVYKSFSLYPSFLFLSHPCQSLSFCFSSYLHVFSVYFLLWSTEFNLVLPCEHGYGTNHWGMRDSQVATPQITINPLSQTSTKTIQFPLRKVRTLCHYLHPCLNWVFSYLQALFWEPQVVWVHDCSVHANNSCLSFPPSDSQILSAIFCSVLWT